MCQQKYENERRCAFFNWSTVASARSLFIVSESNTFWVVLSKAYTNTLWINKQRHKQWILYILSQCRNVITVCGVRSIKLPITLHILKR